MIDSSKKKEEEQTTRLRRSRSSASADCRQGETMGVPLKSVRRLPSRKATPHISAHEREARWLLVDASGQVVGKLATLISRLLMGKDQPTYNPAVDSKTNIVVINAVKVKFTGNKLANKEYVRHSGYPGGLKTTTPQKILASKHPERIVEHAVNGMLPKNKLRRIMMDSLYIYAGDQHPHSGQNPKLVKNE